MKVTGTATFHAAAEQVWASLHDPAVLLRTIPGCETLEAVARDRYRMSVTADVAAISGTYVGDVELTDEIEPHEFTLRASGSGEPGSLSVDVRVRLADHGDGTTVLSYDATALIGGPVGDVGDEVLTRGARKAAAAFLAAVDVAVAEQAGSRGTGDRSRVAAAVAVAVAATVAVAAIALVGVLVGRSLRRRSWPAR